jgi:hypothetical protein
VRFATAHASTDGGSTTKTGVRSGALHRDVSNRRFQRSPSPSASRKT